MSEQLKNPSDVLRELSRKIEENLYTPFSSDDDIDLNNKGHPKNEKSRIWVMLLYPDNEVHAEILKTVFTDFVCIGALHDCDVMRNGEKKKEHYHIVFYFTSAVYASHILDKYPKLESRFLRIRKDIKAQVRYLLHLDSPSKYQYPKSYLEGSVERFYKYIDNDELETDNVKKIIDIILDKHPWTYAELLRLMCDNGFYSTYRRNAYTFNKLFEEQKSYLLEEK